MNRFRRVLLGLALFSIVGLAGCLGPGPAADESTDQEPPAALEAKNKTAPESLRFSGELMPSADPMILVDGSICGPTAQCQVFPFDMPANWSVDVVLSWAVEANDLDLHLVQDGTVLASGSTLPPGTTEWLVGLALEPGTYELVVVGFLTAPERFDVLVHFG